MLPQHTLSIGINRPPEADDAAFEADQTAIRADLETLKGLVEALSTSPGYPEAQP
ncbi:hypothetical protein ABI_06790 [Asticcacaulis biprosthecium C19]|uniref:Uncharacterized protein n=1 Tax=Asticcacaulis biprosthecium C19 TaxID=715226 RepID=F4QLA0_9CAUL|nr:hypothetical protein ABI_06790 [Asticcacaulis biprosthecium C19]